MAAKRPTNPASSATNPAAGKRPANARVGSYTRSDGTRVRSHTRTAQIARTKAAWTGLAFSGATSAAIVMEAGITLVSTLAMVVIALLTTVAVVANHQVARNKQAMGKGGVKGTTRKTTRKTQSRRPTKGRTTRTTRRR